MNKKFFSRVFLLVAFLTAASLAVGEARSRADIEGSVTNPEGLDYKQLYHMTLKSVQRWVASQVRMGDEEAPCRRHFLKDSSGDVRRSSS